MNTNLSLGSPFTEICFPFYCIICDPRLCRSSHSSKNLPRVFGVELNWLQGRLQVARLPELRVFPSIKRVKSQSISRPNGQVGIPAMGPALLASHILAFSSPWPPVHQEQPCLVCRVPNPERQQLFTYNCRMC